MRAAAHGPARVRPSEPGDSMRIRLAIVGSIAIGAVGCSSTEVYRAIYGALHAREELVNPPPPTGPATRRPDYAEYGADRQRLRDERGRAAVPVDRAR